MAVTPCPVTPWCPPWAPWKRVWHLDTDLRDICALWSHPLSLVSSKQAQLLQSPLLREMLQTLLHLCGLRWTCACHRWAGVCVAELSDWCKVISPTCWELFWVAILSPKMPETPLLLVSRADCGSVLCTPPFLDERMDFTRPRVLLHKFS